MVSFKRKKDEEIVKIKVKPIESDLIKAIRQIRIYECQEGLRRCTFCLGMERCNHYRLKGDN